MRSSRSRDVFGSETVPATKDSGAAAGSMLYYLGILLTQIMLLPLSSPLLTNARIAAGFVALAGVGIGLQYA